MKISRRKFVKKMINATALSTVASPLFLTPAHGAEKSFQPSFVQLKLPYQYHELEPAIDALTMEIHYSKHHAAYVKNVNETIVKEKITFTSEKDFFSKASKISAKARDNGGGVWNHNFFWKVMRPHGGGVPTGKIADALQGAFGSFDVFKQQFTDAAMQRFGSGWAWLVNDGGKLKIGSTPNQDNPLMDVSTCKGIPILGLDVWEHAYYLKYQNKRNEYVANWWSVVNWDEVAQALK